MFRTISLTAACLILLPANCAVAEKPFKNKTARAAQKIYEAEIAKAKKKYVAKLEVAIKEAGGAGDLDEANRIATEKKSLDSNRGGTSKNPADKLRKSMEGTTWRINVSKHWVRFDKNNTAVGDDGMKYIWVATPKNTIVLQNYKNARIFVWQLDKNLRVAIPFMFTKVSASQPLNRRILKKRR